MTKGKQGAASALAILLTGAVVLTGAASSVIAGFEWRGAAPAAPVSSSEDQSTSPRPDQIQWRGEIYQLPPTVQAPVNLKPIPPSRVDEMPIQAPGQTSVQALAAPEADVVEGFGSRLPLNIALEQVVPPGYDVSYSSGVKPDTIVSWKGGHPWKQVLSEMLTPVGLEFNQEDSKLVVSHAAQAEQISEQMPVDADNNAPVNLMAAAQPAGVSKKTGNKADQVPMDMVNGSASGGPIVWASPAAGHAPDSSDLPLVPIATVPAVPPATEAMPENQPQPAAVQPYSWRIGKKQTLKEALTEWSATAGVTLYWTIDYDYRLNAGETYFEGSYDEALAKLLNRFSLLNPRPVGHLYTGAANGHKVLLIDSPDLSN